MSRDAALILSPDVLLEFQSSWKHNPPTFAHSSPEPLINGGSRKGRYRSIYLGRYLWLSYLPSVATVHN
jgi:hypothetical protein